MTETTAQQVAMKAALLSQPDLQDFGLGAYDSRKKSVEQIQAEIEKGRSTMLGPQSIEQFEKARNWLKQFPKLRRTNRRGTSYGLKHVAEHTIGYCTNGVFIAAAIAEGFEVQRTDPQSPNAWINISSRAWGSP